MQGIDDDAVKIEQYALNHARSPQFAIVLRNFIHDLPGFNGFEGHPDRLFAIRSRNISISRRASVDEPLAFSNHARWNRAKRIVRIISKRLMIGLFRIRQLLHLFVDLPDGVKKEGTIVGRAPVSKLGFYPFEIVDGGFASWILPSSARIHGEKMQPIFVGGLVIHGGDRIGIEDAAQLS